MASTNGTARSIVGDRYRLASQLGMSFGSIRDYYAVLGYPRELTFDNYLAKYERDGMAGRIVDFPAEETWRDPPEVKDGTAKEVREDSNFVREWDSLVNRLHIYHYCERVDRLAGVGCFALLLIGVAGSGDLASEITRVSGPESLLYLRPYSEGSVEIKEYETDAGNPRYGLPTVYELTLREIESPSGQSRKQRVHHTRVLHIAEDLLENEVYGRPRLQRPYNLLEDLLKVVGGSAEATWKLMRKGFLLNIDSEAELSDGDKAAIEEQLDEYDHGLRRFLQTRGMDLSDLGSEVVDPKGLFETITQMISASTGIPVRILLGSERGELASSQDASNWAGAIANRQTNFAETRILRPLIDRFLAWGALSRPSQGQYTVVWPPLFELTDRERAEIANLSADAIAKMSQALGSSPVLGSEWRRDYTPWAGVPDAAALAEEEERLANAPELPEPESEPDSLSGRSDRASPEMALPPSEEVSALVAAAARVVARNGEPFGS